LQTRHVGARVLAQLLAIVLSILAIFGCFTADAVTLPAGFQETIVFSGLTEPTAVRFASDGRVFVAEKSGLIKVFPNVSTNTATVVADLRTNVHNYWDRGLLGFALDPNFPASPYLYVLYSYDATPGGVAPRWGTAGVTSDGCPTPPGATTDGCVIGARLSRLTLSGNTMVGSEQVLIEGWCQQFPSHSIGSLLFGPDGALYASAGDGANFNAVDYGQFGGTLANTPTPANPCGDPPGAIGTALTPPTAMGGALRSQSVRRPAGTSVVLNGSIIRIDPATGAGLPTNPLAGSSDANAKRIIAYGFRNPFRMTLRPGTSEIWVGDVGWNDWEEIDRVIDPTSSPVGNFGWPCYEGNGRQAGYDSANLNLCETLYASPGAVTPPYFTYNHSQRVVAGETCPTGSSSISGLAFEFYSGGSYPADYNGALFFADYSRDCIWVMTKDPGSGLPAPGLIRSFAAGASNPVELQRGPGGDLYYVDLGGTIRRIQYVGTTGSVTSYLSDLPYTVVANGWGPVEKDQSNGEQAAGDGAPLTLNGVVYAKGLGTHAVSDVRYAMNGACTSFAAQVGLDDEVGSNGSVVFQVLADGVLLFDSGLMQGDTATKAVNVNVTGRTELRLLVNNGGDNVNYDHADWADAKVACSNGATNPVPTIGSLAPNSAMAGGAGFTLTVTGQAFVSGASVQWNGAPRTTTFVNATQLTAAIPASDIATQGTANVTVSNPAPGGGVSNALTFTVTPGQTGNQPPVPTISAPAAGTLWKVGDTIAFFGSANDPEDGVLPASALSWSLVLWHCPSDCHTHPLQSWSGVSGGSFPAPDHGYPSYLVLTLTATDSQGLQASTSIRLDPRTVVLTFQSSPGGLQLTVNDSTAIATFSRTVIVGSTNSISAVTPQTKAKQTYIFSSWSDGGAQTHTIVAPAGATTYTARFRR
jgi:glucose/arabinose dehydrogenase